MIKVKNTDNTWSIVSGAGSASIIEKTYSELKALRDASKLVEGLLYKITNYQAYTSLENTHINSNPFDLVVIADSKSTINENALACLHKDTTYFASCDLSAWEIKYSLDANTTKWSWASPSIEYASITVGGVVYSRDSSKDLTLATSLYGDKTGYAFTSSGGTTLRTDSKTEATVAGDFIHYIDTSATATTTIDAYDSTNDAFYESSYTTVTFKYTGDTYIVGGVTYYKMWSDEAGLFMVTSVTKADAITTIEGGSTFNAYNLDAKIDNLQTIEAHTETTEDSFRGVIYYMKDEWNNEAGFDFKGIKIKLVQVGDMDETTSTYVSTASIKNKYVPYETSVLGYELTETTVWHYIFGNNNDGSVSGDYKGNKVAPGTTIPIMNLRCNYTTVGTNCHHISVQGSKGNVIGDSCYNIVIGSDAYDNIIEGGCYSITLEKGCSRNLFKTGTENTILGLNSYKNTISASWSIILGDKCYHNTISEGSSSVYLKIAKSLNIQNSNTIYSTISDSSNFNNSNISGSNTITIGADAVITNSSIENCIKSTFINNLITGTFTDSSIKNSQGCYISGVANRFNIINSGAIYFKKACTLTNCEILNCGTVYLGDGTNASTITDLTVSLSYLITLEATTITYSSITNSSYIKANTGATITNSSIEDCKCESTTPVTINGSLSESKIIGCYTVTVTADGALVRSTIKNGNTITIAGTASQSTISDSDKIEVKKGCTIRVCVVDSSYDIYLGDEDANTVTYYTTHILSSNGIYVRTKNLISRLTITSVCCVYINQNATIESLSITDAAPISSDPITINGTARCSNFKGVVKLTLDGSILNSELNSVYNISVTGSLNYSAIRNISGSGTATIAGTVIKTTMDNCPDCNIASGTTIDSSSFLDMNTLTVRANTTLVRGEFTGCKIIEIGDGSTTSSYDYLTMNSCYKIYFYPVKASHNTLTSCYDTTFTSSLKNFYNNVATGARSLAVSTEATSDMGYYQISAGNYQGKTVNLAWSNYFSKVVYYDNSFTIQQKCVTGS